MCTTCNQKKEKVSYLQPIKATLAWVADFQRIFYAQRAANNPTEEQELIAIHRLATCTTCEKMKQSEVINIANDLVISSAVAEKLEPHLKKQCGLCGCSCVLLAYDQLESSKTCKVDKF